MNPTVIENVAGIVDPVSLSEFKLAVTSMQQGKALIYAFNMIVDLSERVAELEAQPKVEAPPKKAPAAKKAATAKNASNQSGGTLEETTEEA